MIARLTSAIHGRPNSKMRPEHQVLSDGATLVRIARYRGSTRSVVTLAVGLLIARLGAPVPYFSK